MTNQENKERIAEMKAENPRIKSPIRRLITTFACTLGICGIAAAQNTEQKENNPAQYPQEQQAPQNAKKSLQASFTIGAENTANAQYRSFNETKEDGELIATAKGGTADYDDYLRVFASGKLSKGNTYATLSSAGLNIFTHQGATLLETDKNSYTFLLNQTIAEVGRNLPNGATLFVKSGREATEFGPNFANGVSTNNYWVYSKGIATYGNLTERAVLGYKTPKGAIVELGMIANKGDGYIIAPNPKQSDFWIKVGGNLIKNGNIQLSLTGAARIGQTDKVFANATLKTGSFGITTGANYDINNNVAHAWASAAYKSIEKGFEAFAMVSGGNKEGVTASIGVGYLRNIGKTSLNPQFHIDVTAQKNTPATVQIGASVKFGASKTFKTGQKGNRNYNTRQTQNHR